MEKAIIYGNGGKAVVCEFHFRERVCQKIGPHSTASLMVVEAQKITSIIDPDAYYYAGERILCIQPSISGEPCAYCAK